MAHLMLEDSTITSLETSNAVRVTGYGGPVENHTVEAKVTDADASVTALSISLLGSLDGSNFYTLDTHSFSAGELSALGAMFHVVNKPVKYVKVQVASHTGAAAGDTVTIRYEPKLGG